MVVTTWVVVSTMVTPPARAARYRLLSPCSQGDADDLAALDLDPLDRGHHLAPDGRMGVEVRADRGEQFGQPPCGLLAPFLVF